MKTTRYLLIALIFTTITTSCKKEISEEKKPPTSEESTSKDFHIDYETFSLDNGLQVIFHIDRSDPVVAVALTAHVGSAREKKGRTGFAHLFEHLLFLESENLGKGGLDQMSARIGGSGANGSTSRDRTNYYQTVPKDALEKMIWAEADKLGYFINTVTEPVLAKEKQVVKNEKRQNVDNRPYGHESYVIDKYLYPEGHPYNWQVIGSLEDLQNATLQDVKDFYNKWYTPNNVTLTIAGDFDSKQAKEWVHKYFDEIKRGEDIAPLEKRPVTLTATKRLYYEDNFAKLPQLSLTWPSVPQYHPDSYPLRVLATYLSEGKKAPFYKILVEQKQLTSAVNMYNETSELAGQYSVSVRGFNNINLNQVNDAITEAFLLFEKEGISEESLNRIKAGQETTFYNRLSSVLGKGFQLAQYQIFAKDPGFINKDIKNILAVTTEDVIRVYNQYIKNKPHIATSFVPLRQRNLALKDSKLAAVTEEKIIAGAEDAFDPTLTASYEKTPSSFDRSIEPPYGATPEIIVPQVWEDNLTSGLKVYGIETSEVPLVAFYMNIKGGLLLEDKTKTGVSNLLAELLSKGTKNKTPEALENAIESLGANINIYARDEAIVISGSTLSRNYTKTMKLIQEIILEPRWDEKELSLIKQSTLSDIQQFKAIPRSVAANQYAKLIYGENHILSFNNLGTEESVSLITMEDLKTYYQKNISPSITTLHVVGDISKAQVNSSMVDLNKQWKPKEVIFPEIKAPKKIEKPAIYFYDIPGAKQSVLRFGAPALAQTDKDYFPATIMNYRFGGGGFASELTQQLREGKGYTYGIFSQFSGSTIPGPFTITSGVRSNVTYESSKLIREIMNSYGNKYSTEDLNITKSFLTKSNARAFETLTDKLEMLTNISLYNFPYDYVKKREQIVQNITVEDIKLLANTYLNGDKMLYLIVGDAKTQLKPLEKLGLGTPVLLNRTPKK
ncbi:insulinase family protein [Aquimarina sp. TRL1]|uniref:M16 family metallopeptidase n=1 Tax=Aquimarina sp. (strain TRL1) TaxID=2736252 RepID=UPI00158B9B05|nr:pitrilysin family protein [Aquimarina sp. TRL1]QKX05687.1 insulinase family protein [Aquimarina sp. TRL1]